MKASVAIVVLLLFVATAACNAGGAPAAGPPESLEERASYAIGLTGGQNFRRQGADIDIEQFAQGLRDALEDNEPAMTQDEIQATMAEFQQMLAAGDTERDSAEGAANAAAGEAFLAENGTKDGVVVLESGLQYEILNEGSGASPTPTDRITIHYEGTLIDGTVFDSSVQRGTPATFTLNQLIPGWIEGMQLMKVGSKWRLFVPGDLAYGMTPRPGGPIGPNATLIFEIELLAVNGE